MYHLLKYFFFGKRTHNLRSRGYSYIFLNVQNKESSDLRELSFFSFFSASPFTCLSQEREEKSGMVSSYLK